MKQVNALCTLVMSSIVAMVVLFGGAFAAAGLSAQRALANELSSGELAVQADANQQDRHNAYYLKLQDYIAAYGSPSVNYRDNGTTELNGLCLAVLQDYDRDGQDELLVAYYDPGRVSSSAGGSINYAPAYVYEVWTYEGGAVQVAFQHTAQWTNGGLGYVPLGCSFEPFGRDGSYVDGGAYLYHETTEYASGTGGTQSTSIWAMSGGAFSSFGTMESTGAYTSDVAYRINGQPCTRDEAMAFVDDQVGSHESTNYWMMAFSSSPVAGVSPGDVLGITHDTIEALRITESFGARVQVLFRGYNPYTGEHFYTADESERDSVVSEGWIYEGVGWIAPESGDPVYRLYNPYAGEHHYTLSADERDALVGVGWVDEGVSWYSDPGESVPLYREYNPNQFSCNHNYTTSRGEHDGLVEIGWRDEGIGWYALDAEPVDPDPLTADDAELIKLGGWWQVMREGGVRVYHFVDDDLYYYSVANSDGLGWDLDDPAVSVELVSQHKVSLTQVENVHVERAATLVNGHGPGYLISASGLASSYYLFEDELDVLYDSSGTTMCFGRISPSAVLLEAAEQYEG